MLVDDKGRLFGKINLVDLLIILIVLAAGIFLFTKFGRANVLTLIQKEEPVVITLFIEGLPEYAADAVKDGAVTIDKNTSTRMGKVVEGSIKKGPDIWYAANSDGQMVRSSREGFCSLEFSVEGSGVFTENGVTIGTTTYLIYRSTDVRVGDVELYTRIKSIEKK